MDTPTTKDLNTVIRINLIKNSKIISEDMDLVEKAFGSDISSLKGETTRKRLIPMSSSVTDIPTKLLRVNEKVEILLDSLQVNGLQFILSIAHNIFCRIA